MNHCLIHNARVYNSRTREFFDGSVLVSKGKIAILHRGDVTDAPEGTEIYDAEGRMVIPGMVDIHTHGRAGGDFNTADGETADYSVDGGWWQVFVGEEAAITGVDGIAIADGDTFKLVYTIG